MAGSYICCNTGRVFTNDNGFSNPISAISYTPIFISALAQALTLTSAFALIFVLGLPGRYTDENLQKVTKFALESFFKGQNHGQL